MTNKENWTPHFRGYFKFKDDYVSLGQIEELAQQWATDEKYLNIYIRKTSSDQHGIGFTYNPGDVESTKDAQDEYLEQQSDMLKKQFGNGLAGWDISSSYLEIK